MNLPKNTSPLARICLTCTEKRCDKPLHCKRYKEEKKKLTKRAYNRVTKD
jgi:hypothetical protein